MRRRKTKGTEREGEEKEIVNDEIQLSINMITTSMSMNFSLRVKGITQCWSRSWIWWKCVFLGASR